MFACLANLFDAIANQNFWAHQPYPDGHYQCQYTYSFPGLPTVVALELVKVDAPNWDFTFSDIAYDLSAIFNAAQQFTSPVSGVPQMDIKVFRYRNGESGPTFFASQGTIVYGSPVTVNTSVA